MGTWLSVVPSHDDSKYAVILVQKNKILLFILKIKKIIDIFFIYSLIVYQISYNFINI
jgi:hypothetical protein